MQLGEPRVDTAIAKQALMRSFLHQPTLIEDENAPFCFVPEIVTTLELGNCCRMILITSETFMSGN